MGKKGLLAVLIAYFLFSLLISMFVFQIANVHAQEIPGLPAGLSPEEVEKTQEKVEGKWDYLAREWKNILLKNKFVSAIDSFFTKISFVFRILFGMEYSMSLVLLIVIILWFYFLINLLQIYRYVSIFSGWVNYVVAFGLVIIAAQTKVLEKIAKFVIWFILGIISSWWFSLIIMVVLIIILIILYKLNKSFAKQVAANRKKMKIEVEERKLEKGAVVGEALSKAAEDIGKKE
ncbi:hypothetical protein HYT26_03475 [Candidatus Pacearchaeota archaeon]|nr:hypothetical protein [Candidatus Pacearchaeota archaeon]